MNAWFLATIGLGAALFALVAVAPRWRRTGGRAAAEGFVFAARGGELMIGGLSGVSALLGVAAAFDDADFFWALGAAALAGGLAVQVLAMAPPAREIARLAASVDTELGQEVDVELARWIRLAWARLGLFGLGVLFYIIASH